MNNDSFPTGNQASVYAKHSLHHWATALALENDFLEWDLRKRQSQGPRNRPPAWDDGSPDQTKLWHLTTTEGCADKRPPSSVTGPWGRPERAVSDDSAVTCGEPAKGLPPGTRGSRRGNDVCGGLATYTCWHICGFPSRKGLLRYSAFCSWVKI